MPGAIFAYFMSEVAAAEVFVQCTFAHKCFSVIRGNVESVHSLNIIILLVVYLHTEPEDTTL